MNVWVISTLLEPEWLTLGAVTAKSKSCLNSCIPSHPFILSPSPSCCAVILILVLLLPPPPRNVLVWWRSGLMEKECRSEVSHPFDCRQVSVRSLGVETRQRGKSATADLWSRDSPSESLCSLCFFSHIQLSLSRVMYCRAVGFF